MKKLIAFQMICTCFIVSCNSNLNTKPVLESAGITSSQQEKIADTVKSVIRGFVNAANEANAVNLSKYFSRSPQLRIIDQNGFVIKQSDTLNNLFINYFAPIAYQNLQLVEPDINVLSADLTLAVYAAQFTSTFKDSSVAGGPFAWTLLLTRESGEWKILNLHQSIKWDEKVSRKGMR
jgi:hypothetical protein